MPNVEVDLWDGFLKILTPASSAVSFVTLLVIILCVLVILARGKNVWEKFKQELKKELKKEMIAYIEKESKTIEKKLKEETNQVIKYLFEIKNDISILSAQIAANKAQSETFMNTMNSLNCKR